MTAELLMMFGGATAFAVTLYWVRRRELREKYAVEMAESDSSPDLRQFHAAVELFYPGSRRGAAGPLESTFDSVEPEEELLEVS